MSQTVWIARHANRWDFVYPEWFTTAERPYDPPLSEDGFEQAKQLASRLATTSNIRHIFASPFLRTVQTAHEVAQKLNLPLKLEWGLAEWLNPHWMTHAPETLPLEILQQDFPEIDRHYHSRIVPEYPESEQQVFARTQETAKRLVAEFSEDILLIGHGASVLGASQALVPGAEIRAALCCLVKIVRKGDIWEMELHGDTSHLSETETVIRFN
jgi:broad specificity phosphatase PhoE